MLMLFLKIGKKLIIPIAKQFLLRKRRQFGYLGAIRHALLYTSTGEEVELDFG